MEKKNLLYLGILALFVVTYVVLLGSYPLLDPDETRYVSMGRDMFQTKDYMTLYLNGEYFFEKPPLFFWLEVFSFKLFGVSEWTARLPIVLLSLLPAGFLFALCKKVKDTKFAFITTAILFTCLEYVIITKMAILDSVLTSFVSASILAYFYTFFAEEKNKKYFWLLSYIFCGLATLAKGIPGVALPAAILFISTIVFKTYKETLKFFPIGLIIFGAIVVPWHVLMLKMHNPLFYDEYVMKHHILRFVGSDVINRKQPFYFYILTLLWGLFPWIFSFVGSLFKKVENFKIKIENNSDKFYVLNLIAVGAILLFFSASGTKLITYIQPIYPFLAVLIGKVWYDYINENKNEKGIKIGTIVLNSILLIACVASFFVPVFLPKELYNSHMMIMQILLPILFGGYCVASFISMKKENRLAQFLSTAIFMGVFASLFTPFVFKFDYALGQDDLMKYAKIAQEKNSTISGYNTGRKYSLIYYSGLRTVKLFNEDDFEWLRNELKKENHIVITRNKVLKEIPFEVEVLDRGVKFSMIGEKK